MQGTPVQDESRGRAGIALLGRLGYAAAALGDHDFDWSRRRAARSGWRSRPTRGSRRTCVDSATGPAARLDRRRIGCCDVAGMTGRGDRLHYARDQAPAARGSDPRAPLRRGRAGAARRARVRCAARQPALTILLAHAGGAAMRWSAPARSCGWRSELGRQRRAADRRGPHASGDHHARRRDSHPRDRKRGADGRGGGSGEDAGGRVRHPGRRGRRWIPRARAATPRFRAALETYARRSDSVLARPLAELKRPLVRAARSIPLGALIADARRNALRTDLGLVRSESIRADLPAGPATYARLSAVEPAAEPTSSASRHRHAAHGRCWSRRSRSRRADACTWPGRRCATIRGRRRASGCAAWCSRAGARSAPTPKYTLATDDADGGGRGRPEPAARACQYQRAGLIDVEAVAAFLRRLPQPVEAAAARRLRLHPTVSRRCGCSSTPTPVDVGAGTDVRGAHPRARSRARGQRRAGAARS